MKQILIDTQLVLQNKYTSELVEVTVFEHIRQKSKFMQNMYCLYTYFVCLYILYMYTNTNKLHNYIGSHLCRKYWIGLFKLTLWTFI